MVYDLGFGLQVDPECEPDLDWDAICPKHHYENRAALRDLLDTLYNADEVNLDFLEEKLEVLAENYEIAIPDKVINLRRNDENK